MKKLLLSILLFTVLLPDVSAQTTVQVLSNSATTTNPRAPRGDFGAMRLVYYISAAEITAASIPLNGQLSAIGFSYSAAATVAATGTMKIYLQNTSDTYLNKSTTWTSLINDMTIVKNESTTIPTTTSIKYGFQNNFKWTGGGLYVAIEFINAAATPNAGGAATVRTNGGTFVDGSGGSAVTIRYSTSTNATPPTSTSTTSSTSRPATALDYYAPLATDLTTDFIYALDKKPIGTNGAENISAIITNTGGTTLTNRNVTLTVSGANSYTNTKQIVSLVPGASTTVVFDSFSAATIGTNTISVKVQADDDATGDEKIITQTINDGIFAYPATLSTGNLGVGGTTGAYDGILLVKYHLTGTASLNAVNVTIGNSTTLDGENIIVYAVLLNASGTTLGRSSDYTLLQADKGVKKSFLLQTPASLTDQDFYVGLAYYNATVATFPVRYFAESPFRPNTVYKRNGLDDATALTASTSGLPFIEAVLSTSTLPVTVSSFDAQLSNYKVNLKWSVGTEINVNRYEIERMQADGTFLKVAETIANGSSQYFAIDYKPLNGNNYYRLKTVDNDGTSAYFHELKNVKFASLLVKTANIYPNPVVGNELNVSLVNYPNGQYTYKVVSMSGTTVQQGQFNNNGSKNTIGLTSSIGKGVYILYITSDKEVIQSKIFKN